MTIAQIRQKVKWSQNQFASYFDIPVHTVQNWEQGLRTPPDYLVNLIQRTLIADGYLTEEDCDE